MQQYAELELVGKGSYGKCIKVCRGRGYGFSVQLLSSRRAMQGPLPSFLPSCIIGTSSSCIAAPQPAALKRESSGQSLARAAAGMRGVTARLSEAAATASKV